MGQKIHNLKAKHTKDKEKRTVTKNVALKDTRNWDGGSLINEETNQTKKVNSLKIKYNQEVKLRKNHIQYHAHEMDRVLGVIRVIERNHEGYWSIV